MCQSPGSTRATGRFCRNALGPFRPRGRQVREPGRRCSAGSGSSRSPTALRWALTRGAGALLEFTTAVEVGGEVLFAALAEGARTADLQGIPPHVISMNDVGPLHAARGRGRLDREGRPRLRHVGEILFRTAIPDVDAVRDVIGFARSLA